MSEYKLFPDFKPRPYQKEFLQAMSGVGCKKKRRAILRWSRRSGKDLTCTLWAFSEMLRTPANYLYFFPQYSQGRKAFWERLDARTGLSTLDQMPKQLIKRINNQDMILELQNGSTLRVVGSDNIDSVIGTNPYGVVFSEYAYSDPYAWVKMSPVLAENNGWAVFNSTPHGRNHFFDFWNRSQKLSTWYSSEVQSLWPEKPSYYPTATLQEIEDIRASGVEEAMIEQEFGVSFTAGIKGAFYADVLKEAREAGRIGKYPPCKRAPVETYWDLGSRDDTSIWFMQKQGNGYVFIDYYENNGQDIGHYAEVLLDKGYNYSSHHLPWDGANKTVGVRFSVDRILKYSLKELKISDDVRCASRVAVQEGIQAVRSLFDQMYFHEDNTEDGLTKLEAYHRKWDSKKQVYLKQPDHDWSSHAADAMRTFAYFNVLHHGFDKDIDAGPVQVITEWNPLDD